MSISTESHSLEILLLLLLLVTTFSSVTTDHLSACNLELVPYFEDCEYVQDGDIIIGGIFSVHCSFALIKYQDVPHRLLPFCLRPLHQFYRNLQLFLFTIDQINKDPTLLPNRTLGYHIYDSCAYPGIAIRSVLQMLSGPEVTVPNYSCTKNWRLGGFIGDQSTTTTLPIAQFLNVYEYPLISYGATDSVLGNRQRFPNFLRTIQNDDEILVSLCRLISYFGWTWVGIITSYNESGLREVTSLLQFLSTNRVCVGFVLWDSINLFQKRTHYQGNYEMARKQSVQVVILCGTYHDLIFETSHIEWLKGVTMVLTPSWAPHIVLIEKYPEIFNGSLSLEPRSTVTAEFKHFIDDFYPLKYPKDLLLQNLWMTTFHCLSGNEEKDKWSKNLYKTSLHNCTGLERMKSPWNDLSHEMVDPVYNAVISMAKALNHINLSLNDWYGHQPSYQYQISRYLKHMTYKGHSAFNQYGELAADYTIYNNIIVNGTLDKIMVGFFLPYSTRKNRTIIYNDAIKWKTPNNEIPKSVCSEPCLPGSRKGPATTAQFCCYPCLPCSEGEISNTSDSEICRRCPHHEWPNENQTQCVSKLVEFLSYSHEVISVIVLSGSMLLLTLTAVILGIFIRYRETPIVRANNKTLSFVLLVSIMLSFQCVFLFLGRPVDRTCMIRQIFTGILLSISISSLLAKTITVYMAFKATKPGSVWRRWSGVKLPTCVLLICSSVQGVICMSWVTLSPPFQELDTHSYKEKMVVQCNEGSDLWFYSVLGYMGILATVSFITAFLARTLPDSFNEAKYITFSMLVFCSVWIAMIPAYLSTKGKYMVAVEIFAILTSNAGLLGCIFFPKCYIILFKPELNTKKHILK